MQTINHHHNQPIAKPEAYNTWQDLDYSGCHEKPNSTIGLLYIVTKHSEHNLGKVVRETNTERIFYSLLLSLLLVTFDFRYSFNTSLATCVDSCVFSRQNCPKRSTFSVFLCWKYDRNRETFVTTALDRWQKFQNYRQVTKWKLSHFFSICVLSSLSTDPHFVFSSSRLTAGDINEPKHKGVGLEKDFFARFAVPSTRSKKNHSQKKKSHLWTYYSFSFTFDFCYVNFVLFYFSDADTSTIWYCPSGSKFVVRT